MKRTTILLFSFTLILILGILFTLFVYKKDTKTSTSARIVIPVTGELSSSEEITNSDLLDDTVFTSLVKLNMDETLINTLSADFDNDTFEDQIVAVKKGNSSFISLIIGIYNPILTEYVRSFEITTEITQVKTFMMTTMDLTGLHINSIIYTGFTSNMDNVLCVLNVTKRQDIVDLKTLANLKSNGTIFIEQVTQNEMYSLTHQRGESSPIWVYRTETQQDSDTFDQIQTVYEWNEISGIYEATNETKVSGKNLAAKELARIQDGTIETFNQFLAGLWYRTESPENDIRYLFFNPTTEEIIFVWEDIQEIYSWITSSLRRNGIYLTASNKTISNLTRYFDISLSNVDEIKVRIRDDVRMAVGMDTQWEGTYKKKLAKTELSKDTRKPLSDDIKKIATLLTKDSGKWTVNDRNLMVFENDTYTYTTNSYNETGVFLLTDFSNHRVIQFKTISEKTELHPFYEVFTDGENLTLQPVTLSISGCHVAQGRLLKLSIHIPE